MKYSTSEQCSCVSCPYRLIISVITRSKSCGFGGGLLANVDVPRACSCQVIGRVVSRVRLIARQLISCVTYLRREKLLILQCNMILHSGHLARLERFVCTFSDLEADRGQAPRSISASRELQSKPKDCGGLCSYYARADRRLRLDAITGPRKSAQADKLFPTQPDYRLPFSGVWGIGGGCDKNLEYPLSGPFV